MSLPSAPSSDPALLAANLASLEALPLDGEGRFKCDFVYRDVHFVAQFEGNGDGGLLHVTGDAGPMPYSAESPAARAGLARIMVRANDHLGPLFRLERGRVSLGAERGLSGALTPSDLMAAVAAVLIPATPYLELMSMYVRPPLAPAKAGESAVRAEWRRNPAPAR